QARLPDLGAVMPLQTSPPISLSDVYAEFAAPAGTPLSAFVRGGAYVPDVPANAGVPTAPPVSLLQLLGARKSPVILLDASQSAMALAPNNASASLRFNGLLVMGQTNNNAAQTKFTWLAEGGGAATDYE